MWRPMPLKRFTAQNPWDVLCVRISIEMRRIYAIHRQFAAFSKSNSPSISPFLGHFVIFIPFHSCPSKCFCVQRTHTHSKLSSWFFPLLRGYNSQTLYFLPSSSSSRCCWKHWITNSNQNYWIDGIGWQQAVKANATAAKITMQTRGCEHASNVLISENNVSDTERELDSARDSVALPWWRWI